MNADDRTVRDILNELEDLNQEFPEEKDEIVRLLSQEEDLAFGVSVFDSAMEHLEDHLNRGAEVRSELDIDQLRDDRSALRERYGGAQKYSTRFWQPGQMLDDILQNEDYMSDSPDGPVNELVHLHPNDDGGLLLQKTNQVENAQIVYPSGETESVEVDYHAVERSAQEGAKRAIEAKNIDEKLTEVMQGQREIKEELENVSTKNSSRRNFLKKGGAALAAVAGAGIVYEGTDNNEDSIFLAKDNMGEKPADYNFEVLDDSAVQDYVDNMAARERYSKAFQQVDDDIEGREANMGFLDDENRIDFYDETVLSSVEMSDNLYQEAIEKS